MKLRNGITLHLLILVAVPLAPVCSTAGETCYLSTPSSYQKMGGNPRYGPYSSRSQCDSVNSQYFSGNGSCSCSSSSDDSDSSVLSTTGGVAYQLGAALGQMLAGLLFGSPNHSPNPIVTTPPAAGNSEVNRELQRQQWKQEMQALQAQMKGPGPPTGELKLKETQSVFGGQSSRDLTFKDTDKVSTVRAISDPLEQLRVSTCLTQLATQAKTDDEANYLSNQAARALHGETVAVDISSCKGAGTAPSVEGHSVSLTPDQTSFFKTLLEKTNKEVVTLAQLNRSEKELKDKKQELDKAIETKQREVQQIQEQPLTPDDPQATEKKQSALDAAQAALRNAQGEDEKTASAITAVQSDEKTSADNIKKFQTCSQQAYQDPSKLKDLSDSCTQ
jgi:hypothetical protein